MTGALFLDTSAYLASAVGSSSRHAFGISQVLFPGPAQPCVSCQLLVKECTLNTG